MKNIQIKNKHQIFFIAILLSLSGLFGQECSPGGDGNNLCLSFGSIDPTEGTIEIYYSSIEDVNFLQFTLVGLSIINYESNLGDVVITSETGGVLASYLTGALPAGDGLYLMTIYYIPEPVELDLCLVNGASPGFEVPSPDCETIDPCEYDCNDDCSGLAFIDNCGECSEGNTGHVADSDIDCNGDCHFDTVESCEGENCGNAYIDLCGVCSEGNSGHIANSGELGCGCFVDAPILYYEDLDADEFGYGEGILYCTELGEQTAQSTNYTPVPSGWVANSEDCDAACNEVYTDCAGFIVECGCDHICLDFINIDDTGSFDVSYNSYHPISAFQLNLDGIEITSVSSEFSIIEFNPENSTIFGIDMSGSQLPSGNGILFTVNFTPYGYEQDLCISSALISGTGGTDYPVSLPDCVGLNECSNADCNNICGGDAELDDCGICSGGNTGHEPNSGIDCNGECGGTANYDDCGVCSGGSTNLEPSYFNDQFDFSGAYGCDGICFSDAVNDDCSVCGGDNYFGSNEGDLCDCEENVYDCNGDCGAGAFWDDCGICVEGNTGITENYNLDLCGVCYDSPEDPLWNSECGGCMDPNALNYDPEAILPAGECEYLGDVYVALWGDDELGNGLPDQPYKSIQKGIDMVQDGDTVVVTSGTYIENNISFPSDKSLTVWGLDGPEATTLTDEWQIVYWEDFEEYAHLDSSDWNADGTYCGSDAYLTDGSYNGSQYLYVKTDGCNDNSREEYAYSPSYLATGGNYKLGWQGRWDWHHNCNHDYQVFVSIDNGNWESIYYSDCEINGWSQKLSNQFTIPDGEHDIKFYFRGYHSNWGNMHIDDMIVYKQFENDERDPNSTNPIFSIENIQGHTINIEGLTLDESHATRGRIFYINNSDSINIKNINVNEWDEFHSSSYGDNASNAEDGQYIYIEDSNVSFDNISFSDINMYSMNDRYGIIHIDESTVSFNNLSMQNIISGSVELRVSSMYGNCLYIEKRSDVTINNSLFQNSQIFSGNSTYGGVIYLNTNNDEVNANNLIINNTSFINNGLNTDSAGEYGGVIYSQNYNNIIINDSNFDSNYAGPSGSGGAIWLNEYNNLEINNSSFSNHSSNEDNYYTSIGGVIYGNSRNNVLLHDCIFDSSFSNSNGGTISLDQHTNLDIINTSITNSVSNSSGGALYIGDYSTINLNESSVSNNSADNYGGSMRIGERSRVNSAFSHFDNNIAGSRGGGIYFQSGNPDTLYLYNSTINNNSSNGEGGGIYIYHNGEEVFLDIDESSISGNTSNGYKGGGIYGRGTLNVNFSDINDNTCENDGGGIYWEKGQVTVERTDIRRNHASRGGGVFILAENPIFQFDVIALNDATTIGGGMYIAKESTASSTPIIFNSTVVYNTSAVLGSGLLCTSQTNPVVQNSIFWGNLAADGVQMHLQGSSEIFVTYSDVAGGESGIVGFDDIIFQNNIDIYPDFVDVDGEDYNLLITSPSIDAGNPNAPYDPDGTIPDQGAYYFAQDGIPNIGCDIDVLDFGGVASGEVGNISLPIFNTGLSELEISGVIIEPNSFSILDSTFVVGSMQTYDVQMQFIPENEGIYNGTITFLTNDPDELEFAVDLHGAGDGLDINHILDVPNDNGGHVAVAWHRNVFDGIDLTENITHYNVWRRYEVENSDNNSDMLRWPMPGSRDDVYWEMVGSAPAMDLENYSYSAPTVRDSSDTGVYWSVYMVSAHTNDDNLFFVSLPDSGYSIDNLAPAIPENLVVSINEDDAELQWSHVPDQDFNYYNIYSNFELIGQSIEPEFLNADIPAWINIVYEISAVDFNGNESARSENFVIIRNVGDVNFDDMLNIMDLVMIVGNILGISNTDFDEVQLSAADSNYDGELNILDVVTLLHVILENEGALSRVVSEAKIFKNSRVVNQVSSGMIAYDFTISHGNNIDISLTNDALIALSNTDGTITRIIIVNPQSNNLFEADSDFEILEVIAASGDDYIDLSINELPNTYSLLPAYPNPFNPVTNIGYTIPRDSFVKILVYDISGRIVSELVNKQQSPGEYFIDWDASQFASGMYLVQMSLPGYNKTQKLLLLK